MAEQWNELRGYLMACNLHYDGIYENFSFFLILRLSLLSLCSSAADGCSVVSAIRYYPQMLLSHYISDRISSHLHNNVEVRLASLNNLIIKIIFNSIKILINLIF